MRLLILLGDGYVIEKNLKAKIEEHRPRTARLVKEFGKVKIDEVTIDQCIGGARDIRALVTDISYLDPQDGITFRGKTIEETFAALPKAEGSEYPTVEAFWFFLLTGDIPTQEQVEGVMLEFKVRQHVPHYVFEILNHMPIESHPMTMLSTAILAMQKTHLSMNTIVQVTSRKTTLGNTFTRTHSTSLHVFQ